MRTRCAFSSRTRKRFERAPSLQSLDHEPREDLGADARQCPLPRQIVFFRACVPRSATRDACRQSIFEFTGQRARVTFPQTFITLEMRQNTLPNPREAWSQHKYSALGAKSYLHRAAAASASEAPSIAQPRPSATPFRCVDGERRSWLRRSRRSTARTTGKALPSRSGPESLRPAQKNYDAHHELFSLRTSLAIAEKH